MYIRLFHVCGPVPARGWLTGHTGLTIDCRPWYENEGPHCALLQRASYVEKSGAMVADF